MLMRATPVSPAVVLLDQSGEEQESLALQLCEEPVRGAFVGTVATPQRTAIVAAELLRVRPVLDLPPILPPAEPPPTYRLSSAEVVAVERAVRVAGKFRKVLRATTKRHRTGNLKLSLVQNLLMPSPLRNSAPGCPRRKVGTNRTQHLGARV